MDKVCPAGIGGPPKHCALLIALYLSALILPGNSQDPQLRITQEALPLQSNSLALALGELLEYNHDAGLTVEKKAVQCDMGERCAMKHGPRIGKLCDCLRGASCNSFMLRCY
ncbi:niq CART3-like isoform 3-T3 [Anomaloglossus baeobatrachus]|uniref:niq CART3-like isoform X3 n=1 Tax=Anomaloglossus baeobatrachus TaxID=238106 RepID=UPI003F501AC9